MLVAEELVSNKVIALVNVPKGFFKDYDVISCNKIIDKRSVRSYLESYASLDKVMKVLKLVCLSSDVYDVHCSLLSDAERLKLRLARALLIGDKVLVLKDFFGVLIKKERDYFQRLVRNLVNKQGYCVFLMEKNLNVLSEFVKEVGLFSGKKYEVVSFYDLRLSFPIYTVELINYLNECGHDVSNEVTFLETLKAIYRGVK